MDLTARVRNFFLIYWQGLLNSYSQIFFSNKPLFGFLLLCITFFDVSAGVCGVLGILTVQSIAEIFGFNREHIRNGFYTYNTLLVCLGIGALYKFDYYVIILVVIASVLTFLISIWSQNLLYKYKLPILSIPFLIVIWLTMLGAGNFSSFQLVQKDMFTLYNLYPNLFISVSAYIDTLQWSNELHLYFRSLGAIFFQYNDLSGILIALGLLFVSRISFFSSLMGFLLGFFFYKSLQGDFTHLIYSYVGFNFILTAIALNGFFVVSNRKSILLLCIIIPVISLLISSLFNVFIVFNLPVYSLPFNIVVLLVISTLSSRATSRGVYLVQNQQYSSEKNHYEFYHYRERYKAVSLHDISLPVHGQWHISQGHSGEITHKDAWKHAWDFDIRDEQKKTYKKHGTTPGDYYCYGLPVLAPASGWVVRISNETDDNQIGNVNITQNWGNTIVVQHGEYLYSSLSHLKKDSFVCKQGDYVNKGDVIAYVGNSGRSPEPHLHFQLQSSPHIGAETIYYPISHFIKTHQNETVLRFYSIPAQGETIQNIIVHNKLFHAFNLIPGKKLSWKYNYGNKTIFANWKIHTDAYNKTYIHCESSGAIAYFTNNGTVFYFTYFTGSRKSLLYYFYLAAQKCILGYYETIELEEPMLTEGHFNPLLHAIHDLTAPLFHYLSCKYHVSFKPCLNQQNSGDIHIESRVDSKFAGRKIQTKSFDICISDEGFSSFQFIQGKKSLQAICISIE